MATHSSILAWRIPWTEEPARLHTACEVTKIQTQLVDYHFHVFTSSLFFTEDEEGRQKNREAET